MADSLAFVPSCVVEPKAQENPSDGAARYKTATRPPHTCVCLRTRAAAAETTRRDCLHMVLARALSLSHPLYNTGATAARKLARTRTGLSRSSLSNSCPDTNNPPPKRSTQAPHHQNHDHEQQRKKMISAKENRNISSLGIRPTTRQQARASDAHCDGHHANVLTIRVRIPRQGKEVGHSSVPPQVPHNKSRGPPSLRQNPTQPIAAANAGQQKDAAGMRQRARARTAPPGPCTPKSRNKAALPRIQPSSSFPSLSIQSLPETHPIRSLPLFAPSPRLLPLTTTLRSSPTNSDQSSVV